MGKWFLQHTAVAMALAVTINGDLFKTRLEALLRTFKVQQPLHLAAWFGIKAHLSCMHAWRVCRATATCLVAPQAWP